MYLGRKRADEFQEFQRRELHCISRAYVVLLLTVLLAIIGGCIALHGRGLGFQAVHWIEAKSTENGHVFNDPICLKCLFYSVLCTLHHARLQGETAWMG